ncbi:hypothetical protein JOC75_001158 [Metabacillus crassostreae]|uniref:hypothetical protein n=1 Tax=Metabacillus crassostreae TaxID=929098 RepID=UPI00195A88F6|nr:hypothetical protein [Metabacillus crassostreae]MBM7603188.1 hypothetical protein [Metabacillus crassostreae]
MIKMYDELTMDEIDWESKKDGSLIKQYFEPLMKNGISKFIENVKADLYLVEIDDFILPLSVNDTEFTNSYVASPFTHYISYAKEELWELYNKPLERLLGAIIDILGFVLQKSNINKVVVVNNWFLSTNLLEPSLSFDQLQRLTLFLTEKFKQHTILFRSINNSLHQNISKFLQEIGYQNVMSRSIYLFNQNQENQLSAKQKKLLKQDEKLILNKDYQVKQVAEVDIERIQELYNSLYIQKYSANNPQFTLDFYRNIYLNQLFSFKLICKNDIVLGIVGMLIRDNVLTTPILGYESTREKSDGLYRVLSFLITQEIMDHHYIGHRSAGAGEFKRKRGSVQENEYTYFYQKHLSLSKKLSWKIVKFIMDKIVEPLAKKKGF